MLQTYPLHLSQVDEKLLPALAATDPLVLPSPDQPTPSGPVPAHSTTSASDDLSLLAHMTSCGSDLTQSHTSGELPEDGPFKIQSPLADISSIAEAESQSQIQGASRPDFSEGEVTSGAEGEAAGLKTGGDTASTTSDTERSDDGKDKDTKKIQTTATTQVCLVLFFSTRREPLTSRVHSSELLGYSNCTYRDVHVYNSCTMKQRHMLCYERLTASIVQVTFFPGCSFVLTQS